jgi:hypothetical protein
MILTEPHQAPAVRVQHGCGTDEAFWDWRVCRLMDEQAHVYNLALKLAD